MDKKIEDINIKLTVDDKDIYKTGEYPYLLVVGDSGCGLDEETGICSGDTRVEFVGSLNNSIALLSSVISMIIQNSEIDKNKESIMKFLNVICSLVLDYLDKNETIDYDKKGVMH